MDVVWKGLLGGIVTALIVLASKRGNVLPGILPLAPTFAVIALLAVGSKGDPAGFKQACLAGAKTAIKDGLTTWRSGSARRTQFRCGACRAMLVRSRLTRLEPGWRIGHLSSGYGLRTGVTGDAPLCR